VRDANFLSHKKLGEKLKASRVHPFSSSPERAHGMTFNPFMQKARLAGKSLPPSACKGLKIERGARRGTKREREENFEVCCSFVVHEMQQTTRVFC